MRFEFVEVVHVEGLAREQHDVVADVDDVVDGTDALGKEQRLHPFGRRGDFDTSYDADRELLAFLRFGADFKRSRLEGSFFRLRKLDLFLQKAAKLPGDVFDRVKVGAVRENIKIKDDIREAKIAKDVFVAHFRVKRELFDASKLMLA